jgi:hypothetical protein
MGRGWPQGPEVCPCGERRRAGHSGQEVDGFAPNAGSPGRVGCDSERRLPGAKRTFRRCLSWHYGDARHDRVRPTPVIPEKSVYVSNAA